MSIKIKIDYIGCGNRKVDETHSQNVCSTQHIKALSAGFCVSFHSCAFRDSSICNASLLLVKKKVYRLL